VSTYSRRGIHGHVVNELGLRITRGEFTPGQVIDPNDLLQSFGVSRTVIREALKVLATKGLVDARPKRGTFITERSRWQLLDGDVMRWRSEGTPDLLLLLELGEVRQAIEPVAARMAALRRNDEQLKVMEESLVVMDAWDGVTHDVIVGADLAFHSGLLKAAGNELLEQFEVILEPALQARDFLTHSHNPDRSFFRRHKAVFDAIAAGDADLAQGTMAEMMTVAVDDAEVALKQSVVGAEVLRHRIRAL
jgi:GntR family transcriptional regulator, galactonate operon transcriptional repressor